MITSAALLMRERGVEATSFSEVVAHSGAPRGSIYHHFPGGKAQLIEEATRYAGAFTAEGLTKALETDDPVAAIRAFTAMWMRILDRSDYTAGCPVVAATLEGDRTARARAAAADAFGRWEKLIAEALSPHLSDPKRARSLATIVIASIEGAVVLSRAQRSSEPLRRVARELEQLLTTAIAGERSIDRTSSR
jgi:AcrR family transcriptional regulator